MFYNLCGGGQATDQFITPGVQLFYCCSENTTSCGGVMGRDAERSTVCSDLAKIAHSLAVRCRIVELISVLTVIGTINTHRANLSLFLKTVI